MKILLANPPWYEGNCFGVRAGSRWPHFREGGTYLPFPFFLGYAASLLEKNGKDIMVIDGVAEKIKNEEFIERIKNYSPDLVLIEVSTPSIYSDLRIAGYIKETLPSVKIAFCGPHIFMFEKEFLEENPTVDFILYGEYENTLLDMVINMEKGNNFEKISGLIYRDLKGEVIKNSPRPLIEDLDILPWPARHLFPVMKYCDESYGVPSPSLQMWASRGCPYGCIFCFWPQVMYGGHKYRQRKPEHIVEEIKFCVDKYGFKSFFFDDDTFNIGKDRVLGICKEIKKSNIHLPWAIMARADTMDFEILDNLKDAGLTGLKYGVESGVQEIVDRSCKSLDLKKVKEIVAYTKKLGIHVHLTFTFGLPGETKETIKKTIDFALELDSDTVQFSIMTPFPGSKYFEELDKEGKILTKDWARYNGSCSAVFETENISPEDLEESVKKAYNIWSAHVLKRNFKEKKFYYLKKGLSNPYKAIKIIRELLNWKK